MSTIVAAVFRTPSRCFQSGKNENHYQISRGWRCRIDPGRRSAPQYLTEMAVPLLAHASHWAMWVLYLVPVVIVLAATVKAFVDQRREEREGGERP